MRRLLFLLLTVLLVIAFASVAFSAEKLSASALANTRGGAFICRQDCGENQWCEQSTTGCTLPPNSDCNIPWDSDGLCHDFGWKSDDQFKRCEGEEVYSLDCAKQMNPGKMCMYTRYGPHYGTKPTWYCVNCPNSGTGACNMGVCFTRPHKPDCVLNP